MLGKHIIGRVPLKEHWQTITDWATLHPGRVIFSNPAEGSDFLQTFPEMRAWWTECEYHARS